MAIADCYEALRFEEGRRIIVSPKVNREANGRVHWHPYAEILLSLSDGNSASIHFRQQAFHRNDIVIIYPGELHAVFSRREEDWLVIQFPSDLLPPLAELGRLFGAGTGPHILRYDAGREEKSPMVSILMEIAALYGAKGAFYETRICACLLSFLAGLGERQEETQGSEGPDPGQSSRIAEACLYIREHCTSPLTLSEAAQHVNMSRSHFSHMFRRCMQMTFIDYLTLERVKRAETLLSDLSRQITEIAFESGFSSLSTFNRAFKKVKSLSPSEYRVRLLEAVPGGEPGRI